MPISIMLVDSHPEREEILVPILESQGFAILTQIDPQDDLLAAVEHNRPDVILIDIDSPDRDSLENLRKVQTNRPRPMVMFTQDDQGESIRRAIEAGVTAYIVDGLDGSKVRPIIHAAMASFKQYQALEQELAQTRNRLEERKLIERAKGLVMQQQGISEPDAYQAMRRLAMRKNKKLAEIAQSLIEAAELMS